MILSVEDSNKKIGLDGEDYYEIHLDVEVVEELPQQTAYEQVTVKKIYESGHPVTELTVYQQPGQLLLQVGSWAMVDIPIESNACRTFITAKMKREVAEQGYLEDVTYTSLAPILRRRGYYLVHAFAAVKDDWAIMLVGPSGSGKSTTGLSLLANGWGFLANDVVLIQKRPDGIYALPTPGSIGISEATIDLVSGLRAIVGTRPTGNGDMKRQFLVSDVSDGWAVPARIKAIYFPRVIGGDRCLAEAKNKAVTLAQLLENSVDRWDSPCLENHTTILQQLCRQAYAYDLSLGWYTDNLSDMLGAH